MNPFASTQDRDLVASILQQFRTARANDSQAKLSAFVLAEDHPLYVPVLFELIRFDREWFRERGNEKSPDEYRKDYPSLFNNPEAVRVLFAAEHHRIPAATAQEPRIDDSIASAPWHPSAGRLAASEEPSASPFRITDDAPANDQSIADSAGTESLAVEEDEFFFHFQSVAGEVDKKALTALFLKAGLPAQTVDLFCDIHRSSPEFAERLARATLSMPSPGDEFLGFHLVDEIGRGAFGRVFLARQKELADRRVVLKVTVELPGESQTLAQLQHTNIVPIYSAHTRGPFHALCMPFFGTTTLADVVGGLGSGEPLPVSGRHFITTVNSRKKVARALSSPPLTKPAGSATLPTPSTGEPTLSSTEAVARSAAGGERVSALQALEGLSYVNSVLWIGSRLAEGLDHAHQRGILHRDLKPANVLLTDDGQPMLLDFNLSEDTKLRSAASLARAGGTLPYMSPEQLQSFCDGRPLDERSDVYSLGLILFEILTGKTAFPRRDGPADEVVTVMLEDRRTQHPRLRDHNGQVSPAVESIVLHCLEPDPDRRYRSARELQDDLERHLDDLPLRHAPEPSLRERARKWRRRHPRLTSSSSVAACCGAILLAFALLFAAQMQRARKLEAQDTLAGFRERVQMAKFLFNKSSPDSGQLEEGARLCDEALARYDVLNGGPRDDLPAVRDLPGEVDRSALRSEIRELLLTRTRATTLLAAREHESAPRKEKAEFGLKLLDLAVAGDGEAGRSKVVLIQRAELNRLLGREDEAHRQQKEAAELTPRAAVELYLLALQLGDRREFARALPLLRESTRRNPGDLWAWFYEGYCHDELADTSEAIRCYTASIALAPQHSYTYLPFFSRGLAYARLSQYEEACADFDEAIRLRPNSADARINRGIARLDWGKYALAIADFDETLRIDPSVTRVYYWRSRAREKAGDSAGARQDREEVLRLEPSDELSWIDRALARADTEPAAALADLDQALKLNPQSLFALQNKAHVLGERLGRQEDAVAVLNTVVELYPGFVRGRVGRGVHLARLGRRAEALEDARQSLSRSNLPETCYDASCIYALTSRKHPEDALECFPLLSMALRQGFGLDTIDSDADLDPVRQQPEFQRMVKAARELYAARKADR